MMRVAFFGFHSRPGGIGNVMVNLMNAMTDLGLGVDVLLHREDAHDLARLLPTVRVVPGIKRGLGSFPAFLRYLSKEKPSWIVCNREDANRLAVLAKACLPLPPKVALRVGTALNVTLARRHGLKRWSRRHAICWAYRRADLVIAVSQGVRQDILEVTRLVPERVVVLANASLPPDMEARAHAPCPHPWLEEEVPVLVGVGRLARQKDFSGLLQAFAQIRQTRPLRLLIVGEGQERQALLDLAQALGVAEDFALAGFSPNPYAYMARAACFVLSSAWEGFGNALAEAMALGVPVVATDCPFGPAELLRGGTLAPLVPVGDVAALARGIEEALSHPPSPEDLRQAVLPYQAKESAKAYAQALGLWEESTCG